MNGFQIRQKLHEGQCVYGTHIASLANPVAAAMATNVDLDFAFFCTEHMPLDNTEVSMLCQFYAARGVSPIVRVPTANPALISRAIDIGAQGIVVPYVETLEEVRQAVGAVRYRPIKGKLLKDTLADPSAIPAKTQKFIDQFNKQQYLIIGIESAHAIENLESLISVDGVDGVFLGPHDITTTMGIPTEYENPLFLDTIEDVIRRCRAQGVGVGIHTMLFRFKPPTLQRLLDAGMNWIINGSDISLMCQTMNQQLGKLREMAGGGVVTPDIQTSNGQPVESCIT